MIDFNQTDYFMVDYLKICKPIIFHLEDHPCKSTRKLLLSSGAFPPAVRTIRRAWNLNLPNVISKKYVPFTSSPNEIAVVSHIRRGDRWIGNEVIYSRTSILIAARLKYLLNKTAVLHVFTENGNLQHFKELSKKYKVNLHIKRSPFDAFLQLNMAPILLMGVSSFSWFAGMLNQNVLAINFYNDTGFPNFAGSLGLPCLYPISFPLKIEDQPESPKLNTTIIDDLILRWINGKCQTKTEDETRI
eukprot:NODE_3704_length_1302_cov_32.340119_g3239_i0.p1 GENE.NODE_3704_length_1302_cov_32.340119_g3239_i0~~NODE_3704_length_1302_cov_32.340119_g3239_i0.p1  ORF type:complete len:245 (+),score=28.63 NODE_3704_length_1302_cov_32.340119_g3239_i0:345-1079(+)